ncbi:chromatin modification-like protein, partial [Wolffia australiana]
NCGRKIGAKETIFTAENVICRDYSRISLVFRLGRRKIEEPSGEEEQDGLSVHSAGQAPPSSASSLPKQEHSQAEVELRVLEALEIYPPCKLQGIHRHFVLYGLLEFLQKRFDRQFTADEVLQLLDRFFNLEMLKPDEEDTEPLEQEEEFALPQSFFIKEEP